MALSMDEQRILDEMERRLADDDPALASRMARFGGPPRLAPTLRGPRARILLCFLALLLIMLVSVALYLISPFRSERQVRGFPSAPNVTQSAGQTPAGAAGLPAGQG